MTAINWALAPEATHYAPQRVQGSDFWCASFVRMEDGVVVKAWVLSDGVIGRVIESPSVTCELIERLIPRPVEWDGQGLPPVGTMCEHKRVHEWNKVEVFAVKPNYNGSQTALFTYESGCWGGCAEPSLFRPIRTPEQIAADERLAAINYMEIDAGISGSAFDGDPEARVWIKNLIDKGWRKPGADQ